MFLYPPQEQHLLRILSPSPCFSLIPEPQRDGTNPVIPLYLGAGAGMKTELMLSQETFQSPSSSLYVKL